MGNRLFLYITFISLCFADAGTGHVERIIDISLSYNGKQRNLFNLLREKKNFSEALLFPFLLFLEI